MNSDLCFRCRFGSVKIEVLVPEKCKPEDFSEQTCDFAAEIIRVTECKIIHYSLGFDSEQDLAALDFTVDCSCILNINKNDCSKFSRAEGLNCRVKHLQYAKTPLKEKHIEAMGFV